MVFTARLGGFTNEIHTGVGDLDVMSMPITLPLVRAGSSDDPQAFFSALEGAIINDQGEVLWHGHEHATGGPPTLGIYQKRFDAPFPARRTPRTPSLTAGQGASLALATGSLRLGRRRSDKQPPRRAPTGRSPPPTGTSP